MRNLPRTITLGELIAQLQAISSIRGPCVPVFVHDADTDWSLGISSTWGVRFGPNTVGEGVEGAVMIQSKGYY